VFYYNFGLLLLAIMPCLILMPSFQLYAHFVTGSFNRERYWRDRTFFSIVAWLTLGTYVVVKTSFGAIICTQDLSQWPDGSWRFWQDPSQVCFQTLRTGFMQVLGALTFLGMIVIFPCGLFYKIRRLFMEQKVDNEHNLIVYGQFYRPYHPKYWWFWLLTRNAADVVPGIAEVLFGGNIVRLTSLTGPSVGTYLLSIIVLRPFEEHTEMLKEIAVQCSLLVSLGVSVAAQFGSLSEDGIVAIYWLNGAVMILIVLWSLRPVLFFARDIFTPPTRKRANAVVDRELGLTDSNFLATSLKKAGSVLRYWTGATSAVAQDGRAVGGSKWLRVRANMEGIKQVGSRGGKNRWATLKRDLGFETAPPLVAAVPSPPCARAPCANCKYLEHAPIEVRAVCMMAIRLLDGFIEADPRAAETLSKALRFCTAGEHAKAMSLLQTIHREAGSDDSSPLSDDAIKTAVRDALESTLLELDTPCSTQHRLPKVVDDSWGPSRKPLRAQYATPPAPMGPSADAAHSERRTECDREHLRNGMKQLSVPDLAGRVNRARQADAKFPCGLRDVHKLSLVMDLSSRVTGEADDLAEELACHWLAALVPVDGQSGAPDHADCLSDSLLVLTSLSQAEEALASSQLRLAPTGARRRSLGSFGGSATDSPSPTLGEQVRECALKIKALRTRRLDHLQHQQQQRREQQVGAQMTRLLGQLRMRRAAEADILSESKREGQADAPLQTSAPLQASVQPAGVRAFSNLLGDIRQRQAASTRPSPSVNTLSKVRSRLGFRRAEGSQLSIGSHADSALISMLGTVRLKQATAGPVAETNIQSELEAEEGTGAPMQTAGVGALSSLLGNIRRRQAESARPETSPQWSLQQTPHTIPPPSPQARALGHSQEADTPHDATRVPFCSTAMHIRQGPNLADNQLLEVFVDGDSSGHACDSVVAQVAKPIDTDIAAVAIETQRQRDAWRSFVGTEFSLALEWSIEQRRAFLGFEHVAASSSLSQWDFETPREYE
jgi:hypothetical protein